MTPKSLLRPGVIEREIRMMNILEFVTVERSQYGKWSTLASG